MHYIVMLIKQPRCMQSWKFHRSPMFSQYKKCLKFLNYRGVKTRNSQFFKTALTSLLSFIWKPHGQLSLNVVRSVPLTTLINILYILAWKPLGALWWVFVSRPDWELKEILNGNLQILSKHINHCLLSPSM